MTKPKQTEECEKLLILLVSPRVLEALQAEAKEAGTFAGTLAVKIVTEHVDNAEGKP